MKTTVSTVQKMKDNGEKDDRKIKQYLYDKIDNIDKDVDSYTVDDLINIYAHQLYEEKNNEEYDLTEPLSDSKREKIYNKKK